MKPTTNISDYFEQMLENDDDLLDLCVGGIAHGIMPQTEENEFPYIVWNVESTTPQRDKDGIGSMLHSVNITIVCRDFSDLGAVVDQAIETMENAVYAWNNKQDKTFEICDQDWEIGEETFDIDHDGPYRNIMLKIETY